MVDHVKNVLSQDELASAALSRPITQSLQDKATTEHQGYAKLDANVKDIPQSINVSQARQCDSDWAAQISRHRSGIAVPLDSPEVKWDPCTPFRLVDNLALPRLKESGGVELVRQCLPPTWNQGVVSLLPWVLPVVGTIHGVVEITEHKMKTA